MKRHAGETAPDYNVAMMERDPTRPIRALHASEEEGGGQAQRNRDDRELEVSLVPILVQEVAPQARSS